MKPWARMLRFRPAASPRIRPATLGVHNASRALVVVSEAEQHRHQDRCNPEGSRAPTADIRAAIGQISPIADFLSKSGKGPDESKGQRGILDVAGDFVGTFRFHGGGPEVGASSDRSQDRPARYAALRPQVRSARCASMSPALEAEPSPAAVAHTKSRPAPAATRIGTSFGTT